MDDGELRNEEDDEGEPVGHIEPVHGIVILNPGDQKSRAKIKERVRVR